jgi:hypothetical protein
MLDFASGMKLPSWSNGSGLKSRSAGTCSRDSSSSLMRKRLEAEMKKTELEARQQIEEARIQADMSRQELRINSQMRRRMIDLEYEMQAARADQDEELAYRLRDFDHEDQNACDDQFLDEAQEYEGAGERAPRNDTQETTESDNKPPDNAQMATRSISPRQRSGDIQVTAEVQQPQPVNAQVARGNAGNQRSTDDTQVIRGICDPAPVNSQIATRSISPRQRVGDVQITTDIQQPQLVNGQVARGNPGNLRSTDETQVIRGTHPSHVQPQVARSGHVTQPCNTQVSCQPYQPAPSVAMQTTLSAGEVTSLAQTLERITAHSELPAPPVMIFDGTPADYPKFIKNFSDRVGVKSFTDSFKLSQLVMCSRGDAKKAIDRYEGTNQGYQKAWKVLYERFGQPSQIVKSCIDKLTGGPRIPAYDRKGLLEFSDLLEATLQTLDDQALLPEANTQTSLQAIFSRLPAFAQGKWIRRVVDIEAANSTPTLKDMVKLVSSLAKTANHAVYSIAATGRNSQVVATGGSKPQGKCPETTSKTNYNPALAHKVTTLSTQLQGGGAPKNKEPKWGGPPKNGNKEMPKGNSGTSTAVIVMESI